MVVDCPKCYGTPCVCEELKNYKPVQQFFFWDDGCNKMIPCGTYPEHPKAKRAWDQAVRLR